MRLIPSRIGISVAFLLSSSFTVLASRQKWLKNPVQGLNRQCFKNCRQVFFYAKQPLNNRTAISVDIFVLGDYLFNFIVGKSGKSFYFSVIFFSILICFSVCLFYDDTLFACCPVTQALKMRSIVVQRTINAPPIKMYL